MENSNTTNSNVSNFPRLVMVDTHTCMICDKYKPNSIMIMMGTFWGWVVCEECRKTGLFKKSVVKCINDQNVIPLHWMDKSRFYNEQINRPLLKFFRYSKKDSVNPIYDCSPERNYFLYAIRKMNDDTLVVDVFFQEREIIKECMRGVTLRNLFAYNPNFYSDLITNDNLFCANIDEGEEPIRWSDISEKMQELVNNEYVLSKTCNPTSFIA